MHKELALVRPAAWNRIIMANSNNNSHKYWLNLNICYIYHEGLRASRAGFTRKHWKNRPK